MSNVAAMPLDDLADRRSIKSWIAGLERAHRAAQHDFLRDHVPRVAAVHLRDAHHARFERMDVARDDRLQRVDDCAANGIGSRPRCGIAPCAPRPGGDDLEDVVRPHQRARAQRDLARPASPGQLCMPYTAFIGKRSNRPSSHHHPPAALVLLGRLEDEIHGAVEVAALAPSRAPRRAASWCGRRGRTRASCLRARGVRARRSRDMQRVQVGAQPTARPMPRAARRRHRSRRAPCAPRRRTRELVGHDALVRVSSNAVSGWAWMSWRQARMSGSSAAISGRTFMAWASPARSEGPS